MAGARSHQTFSESLGLAIRTSEEEGREDKLGYRPERLEQAEGQGQLTCHEYTGDLVQPARCYNVFIPGCLWSLSCCENHTWEPGIYTLQPLLVHLVHFNT